MFVIICSAFFYYYENNTNDKIDSLYDALWWGFVTSTTVGYGDIFPVTMQGRVIAILLMLIGVGVFGFITASFASILVEKNLKKGMGIVDVTFNNHIVIIGWNFRTESIIDELINEDSKIKIAIIDKIDENPYNNKNISYIKGDAWKDKVLKRANIKNAKIVIVLADRSLENYEMIDAKTVLTCLAVDKANPKVYQMAEVINHSNIVHFQRANVNDIIISNELESRILVRSALYKGVNLAIKELITNSYGCEMYETTLNPKYIGKKYEKIAMEFLNKKISLIGFFRNNETYLSPSKDTVMQEGDILIYIADNKII
ncbi:MAG: hypothetical protein FH753_14465 [Firmicutes bacterium]|nr:hypothetical protein [Bacillota bacterium]